MADLFASLLAPLSVEEFFEQYWRRGHVYVSGGSARRFENILRMDDLDVLMQSETLPANYFNVAVNGEVRPVESWSRIGTAPRGEQRVTAPELLFRLYREGATLILNKAHHSLPSLGETCRRLTRELRFLVGANIYMTPANAQGFSKHRDDHDVLILQIDGRKTWIVYPAEGPAVELELRPGDLLFLPRDFWHEARCEASSSVHVTLSLNASTGYELLEELTAVARERAEFRYPIHHGFGTQAARQDFDLDFEGKVLALLREVTGSGLLERRFADLVKNQRQGWRGRLSDIVHLDEITPNTVVCARPEILSRVTSDGKSLVVEFADSRITIPVFLKNCLDRIASGEPFAVKELQGLITESGKLELVKQFVEYGFLAIVRL